MKELNKIYNQDCLIGMKELEENSIDLILCDLPYGTTSCSWDSIIPFEDLWECYNYILKPGGTVVLFGAEPFSTLVRYSNFKNYKYDWYWEKNAPTGFVFAKFQPMRDIETISVFYQGSPRYNPQGIFKVNKKISAKKKMRQDGIYDNSIGLKDYIQEYSGYPRNVLKFKPPTKDQFHPTQKPVELFEYLIKTYTQQGDTVLDNCMGSGTTAIAAINTDRDFIGFETNTDYYERSLERIKNNTTQLGLF